MLVREVQNNNYNNFTFGAKFPKGKFKTDNSFFTVHGEMSRQLSSIVSSFNDMFSSLKKLELQKTNDDAQYALMGLCEKFGIKKVAENVGEGIIFSKGQKDLIVSTHGVDSIRFREVEPRTGEVKESLFIHNKRYVKTDTRDNVYKPLQYWRNDEFNVRKFEEELQVRFDDVDFDILKVRRKMASPEINRFIQQASGSEIQSQINKATIVKPIVVETEQAKPKKKLLSAYEKLLLQRAEQAVKPHKPSIDFYMDRSPIPDDMEIEAKELYLPPIIDKKVSKRGRKPKKIEADSVQPKLKTEIAEEVVRVRKGRVSAKAKAGYLEQQKMDKVNGLVENFERLNTLFKSIKNVQTAGRIKKDYPNLIVPKIQGRYNLILTSVSEKYPQVEMNIFKDSLKNEHYLYMLATDTNGQQNKVAIYLEDGSVLKKMAPKIAREKAAGNGRGNTVTEYFTQEELNKFDTSDLIEPMTEAVKKYADYVASRSELLKAGEHFVAPSKKGVLQAADAQMVQDISSLFVAIREKILGVKAIQNRQKVKYGNGMLIKPENPKSSFQGFRFLGGGEDVLETTVSVRRYSSNGKVLAVTSKKKDGSIEENIINLDKGYVFATIPNAVKRLKGTEQKTIAPRLTQDEVDKKDFATIFAPLKKIMSEYFESVSGAVENLIAGKRAYNVQRPKVVKTIDTPVRRQEVAEVKVAKKRGRPKKVKIDVVANERVNVQTEVAQFLMNGLKEIGTNLKTLQKQLNKMQKELQKIIDYQNN